MNTVVNPATNQWIEAVADTIDQTIDSLKERSVKAVKFAATYPLEVTLTAFALLTILFGIYALLFTPPMPPCVDNY